MANLPKVLSFRNRGSCEKTRELELVEVLPQGCKLYLVKTSNALASVRREAGLSPVDETTLFDIGEKRAYYVLRNSANAPVCILSIQRETGAVEKWLLPSGETPSVKYMNVLARLFIDNNWKVTNYWSRGIIFTTHGEAVFTEETIDVLSVYGDLVIDGIAELKLPRTLIVHGVLFIFQSSLNIAPNYLEASQITVDESIMPKIAEHIVCAGDVIVMGKSTVPELALTLSAGGDLCIAGISSIRKMPYSLKVGKTIKANGTTFDSLGVDVNVSGRIVADNSKLEYRVVSDALGNVIYSGQFVEVLNPPEIDVDGKRIPAHPCDLMVVGRFLCIMENGLCGILMMHLSEKKFYYCVMQRCDFMSAEIPFEVQSLFPKWLPPEYSSTAK